MNLKNEIDKRKTPRLFGEKFLTLSHMMHSQLLEGLKCESEIENNGRIKNRGTLPGS
jgi:hypothetical protein